MINEMLRKYKKLWPQRDLKINGKSSGEAFRKPIKASFINIYMCVVIQNGPRGCELSLIFGVSNL